MVRSQVRERVAVPLPEDAGPWQRHELGAFARYCILRVERERGEWESWVVHLVPSSDGYASHIAIHDHGELLEEQGSGQDGALATWDVMCRIEQRMRERRRPTETDERGEARIASAPRPHHRPARHRSARAVPSTSRARGARLRRPPGR